jgi:tetratricopeptide (TPR) repeat protein
MPAGNVLRLEEYRDRRSMRLRLAEAFHRGDRRREAVFRHLVEVAALTGADRAAAVWVDEHGSGQVHPHMVVDLLSDRPRRAFSSDPLRGAWQLGVPGTFECPAGSASIPSTFAVALGSDGTRAWFLVADSLVPRLCVGAEAREGLMFLAGECAAVVLHRDLDAARADGSSAVAGARFAGWDILADLEGRESDEAESRRIARRFVVLRLVRLLVDDDLAAPRDRTIEQVRRARAEIADASSSGAEQRLWHRTLDALADDRLEDLAATLVELGDDVENQGHTHGAIEIFGCAFSIAAAVGAARSAAQAARLSGRVVRRRSDWTEARSRFELARGVAEAAGLQDVVAQTLVGLAGITRETGNLPAARSQFLEALAVAELSEDGETMAFAHQALLGLEQQAGNLVAALQHGWLAMHTYRSPTGRMRCLASLAGVLTELGDHEAAEDAWTVVAASSGDQYYRVFAFDALGHLAALRGQRAEFERYARECDALGWEVGSGSAKAEILFFRGLSYRALGEADVAKEWLARARSFAEEHGYHRVYFQSEAALRELDAAASPSAPDRTPAAPQELRDGLRAMRQELATARA